jgi:hypothetical protein
MPELRRRARGQAGDHAGHHLRPVQHRGRRVARASAASSSTTSRTTRRRRAGAADPAGQHRHAAAGHAQARHLAGGGLPGTLRPARPGDDDEQVFWREYLLYNREHGFAFLVDAEDGWSWVRPDHRHAQAPSRATRSAGAASTTSATATTPRSPGCRASSTGACSATEQASVTDYVGTGNAFGKRRLSLEQTGGSEEGLVGRRRRSTPAVVAKAFGIGDAGQAASGATAPLSADAAKPRPSWPRAWCVLLVLFVLLMIILVTCSSDDCDDQRRAFGETSAEYQQCKRSAARRSRTSGGSWGGYSSGGGHK